MFKYVNTSKSPGHGQIKNAIIWSEHLVNSEKTILFHRWQARGRIFRDCNLRSRWTNIFTFGTHRSTSTPSPFWGLAPCLRMDNFIPEVREREGNEKNPFPKFGNGKGMKKSLPKVRERELEASILGNDWEREREREWEWYFIHFLDFFLPGSTLKFFSLTLCPKIFSWLPHMYSDSQKKFGTKTQCKIFKFFTMAPYVEVT